MQEESDIAAFKDFVPTEADDSPPATSTPKAEATPPPAPQAPPPPPPKPATPAPAPVQIPPTPAPAVTPAGGRILSTPYARTLAAEKGVDLSVSLRIYLHLVYE